MDYFLKASALVIIFYCCYKLFLQRETFFQYNRWFLLTGLVLATVLPLVVIPIYIEYTPTPINFIESTTVVSQVQSEVVNSITFLEVLFYLYLIGLTYFFGRLVFQFKSLQALLRKENKVKKDSFYFIETEKTTAPFSFFNRIVFNPKQYTKLELSHIIAHEKVHAKQLHSLDIIITQIATVLFWFNPFIWWYKREIQQNLEFIADYNAQKEISCSKSYQTVLLKASINQSELVLPNYFYQSLIKKRIIMLQKSKSKKSRLLKLTIVLPVLALFLMSFNVEERYVAKTAVYENEVNTEDFIITSKSTDKEIEAISIQLEAQTDGLQIKFSNLKRNINGVITNLSIETKAKDKTAFTKHITYKHKEGKPIGNIVLKVENNELIFGYVDIGMNMKVNKDGSTTSFLSKKTSVKQDKKTNAGAIQVQNSVDNTVVKVSSDKNNDVLIMSSLSDGSVEIITQNSDGNLVKNGTVFSSNSKNALNNVKQFTVVTSQTSKDGKLISENKAIVFVNGKKATKEELKNLKPDSFESVTVLKDKSATEKYGFEGANGVVEIITKKMIMTLPNGDTDASNSVFTHTASIQDSLYIVIDGKESNKEELARLNPDKIKTMNVFKNETATNMYGDKGKNGAIVVSTKSYFENDKRLYFLDSKEISKSELDKIYSKELVKSLIILEPKEAIAKYGEKGVNGVVEVISKSSKDASIGLSDKTFVISNAKKNEDSTKKENPWSIQISNATYVDVDDPSKNATFYYISQSTPESILKGYILKLEKLGIEAKYNKIKRNSKGEITSIKISLSDNKGQKSSASYKNNKGIPDIKFGLENGNLIVTSSDISVD